MRIIPLQTHLLLSYLARIILIVGIWCIPVPAGGVVVSFVIRPNYVSNNSKSDQINGTYPDGINVKHELKTFLAAIGEETDSPNSSSCKILSNVVAEGSIFVDNRVATNVRNPWRLLFSQYVAKLDNNTIKKWDSASMTFNLVESGINGANGKWKVNRIGLKCWNLREVDGISAIASPNVSCKITVNDRILELKPTATEQYLIINFDDDEKWIDKLVLATDLDAAVGIGQIDMYLEEVEGFNTLDESADRLYYNESGCYEIPCVKTGNVDFSRDFFLTLLDYNGNVVNYGTESKGSGLFRLEMNDSSQSILEPGLYYACYKVEGELVDVRPSDGVTFEILPTCEGLTINGVALIRTGARTYECAPHTYYEIKDDDGNIRQFGWNNAIVVGHLPGTEIYWKLLSDEETVRYSHKDITKHLSNVRRAQSSIPSDYKLLTGNGINLTNADGSKSGNLGLVMVRNGAVTDPMIVKYSEGAPVVTGINATSEVSYRDIYYTLDGVRVDSPLSGIYLRVRNYPDGHIDTCKVRL